MADYEKLLQIPRATKARLETIKLELLPNTLVFATDTKELGVKLSNGNIEYFKNATDINEIMTGKQDKLIAGDNITIENNVISASGGSGGSGSSTAQFDTLVWSNPMLTLLGIDKLVIHYAYYDKNPKNIMVTLNAGSSVVEIPLPVFASYTFAQFSTEFAGAAITNITEISPDYEFVVFTEDITHINPSTDFLRVFDFNSTCRMIEDEGVSGYVISYRASSSELSEGVNTLGVGFMAVFAGATIESEPILTEIGVGGGGNTYTKDEIDLMVGDIESALDAILGV